MAQIKDLLVLGKSTFLDSIKFNKQVDIFGNAASMPLRVRGIVGSSGEGVTGDLYLQYGANSKVMLGNSGGYYISAAGDYYSGKSANATNADVAGKISDLTTNDNASSSDTWRYIWMSYSNNTTGRPAYDDRFAIQTSTGTLKAPIFSGSLSGNAATASLLKADATALTESTAASALESTPSLKINTATNAVYNNNDGMLLTASWSASYGAQIWLDDGGGEGGMAIRNRNSSGSWNPWRQILSSYNFNSYAPKLDGTGATGTWGINVTGTAGSTSVLTNRRSIGTSAQNHAEALKSEFDANKTTLQRNIMTTYYSNSQGNGSFYMGYFLSGYDTNPYGGFFVAHYNTPYYVGIQNGVYSQQKILTDTNISVSNSAPTLSWGTTSTVGTVQGTSLTVKMPANPNTDVSVTQGLSQSDSWRPILLQNGYAAQGADPGAKTGQVYYCAKASIQTNTGSIYSAGNLTVDGSASVGGHSVARQSTYNNFIHSSNEFTFVSGQYSGAVYLNYRTASGATDGNITQYHFSDGKGNILATISSGQFSGNAATATKATQDGDGNTISSTYLPLSGGTMTGSIITPQDDSMGIIPATNNYGQIGSSSKKFYRMYATTFYGALSGNATTATTLQAGRTIQTDLASTSSASFDGSANITPGVTGTLAVGNGGTGLTSSPSMLTNLGSTTAANVLQASPRPGVTGTLGVANGGTGRATLTSGSVLVGNGTSAVSLRAITNNTSATAVSTSTNLITANTLYYHTGNSNITTVGTITSGTWNGSTIGIAYGGTGVTSNPSMLVNLASTSTDTVFKASPRPGVTGTLSVANGGTGKASWSANRLIYYSSGTALSTSNIAVNGSQLYYTTNGSGSLGLSNYVWGSVYATTFYASSDIRKKKDIKPYVSTGDILTLPICTFKYNDREDQSEHLGCIAQDLQKICPELVDADDEGYLSIKENKLAYVLLERMKEMQKEIKVLKEAIAHVG